MKASNTFRKKVEHMNENNIENNTKTKNKVAALLGAAFKSKKAILIGAAALLVLAVSLVVIYNIQKNPAEIVPDEVTIEEPDVPLGAPTSESTSEADSEPTVEEEIPEEDEETVHEHSYRATVVAPTTTAQGYTQYTCACGSTYRANYTAQLPVPTEPTVTEPAPSAPTTSTPTTSTPPITSEPTTPEPPVTEPEPEVPTDPPETGEDGSEGNEGNDSDIIYGPDELPLA
jgi:hypothetical protein